LKKRTQRVASDRKERPYKTIRRRVRSLTP
jgi:hypothetical protein